MTQQQTDAWDIPVASGQIVTDVEGVLTSAKMAAANQSGQNPMMKLGLTDVKIHASLSPYKHSQFEIETPYNMKGARWIALTESLGKFIGPGQSFGEVKGLRLRFGWSTEITGRVPNPAIPGDWIDGKIEGWVVTNVAGKQVDAEEVSVPDFDIDEGLLELADGQSEGGFTQAAMTDERIKKTPAVMEQVFSQNAGILAPYLEDGRLVKDGEIFRLAGKEAEGESE